MQTTTCAVCSTSITGKRSTKRYCSSRCRVLAFAAKQSSVSANDARVDVSANTKSTRDPKELLELLFAALTAEANHEDFGPRLTALRARWEKDMEELRRPAPKATSSEESSESQTPMTVALALKTLGLKGRFTAEEITKARRTLAKRYHPDLNPTAAAKMAEVNRAADFLVEMLRGMQAA